MSQASISGTRVARRHSVSEDSLEVTPYRERIEQLMRIEGEFLDTPGLMLTLRQAERRFGVDEITCEAILEAWSMRRCCSRRAIGCTGGSCRTCGRPKREVGPCASPQFSAMR